MPKTIFLNVDWDFFIREDPMWDWGHNETALFSEMMWTVRAMSFMMQGVDLDKEMCPWRNGFPKPNQFMHYLQNEMGLKFQVDPADIVVGDSHGEASRFYGGQDLVLNFDAHHDCGYTDRKTLRKWEKQEHTEAGSWLWMLLKRHSLLEAHILYPKWKGWFEYEGTDFTERFEANMWDRVFFDVVEPDVDFSLYKNAVVTGVYIARSGTWTPPWFDGDFIQFISDVYDEVIGDRHEPRLAGYEDVFCEREFDWDAVHQVAAQHKQQVETMNAQAVKHP